MATLISTITVGEIYKQTGTGVPSHIAPQGSEFTDITTGSLYINKDGLTNWILNIDVDNYSSLISLPYVHLSGDTMTGTLRLPSGSTTDPSLVIGSGGTFLSTVQVGAFEFVGNTLYFTDSTSTRRNVLLGASGATATTFDALSDTNVGGAGDGDTVYFDGNTNFWRNTNIISINDDTNTVTINNNLFATNLSGTTIYSGSSDLVDIFLQQSVFNAYSGTIETHIGDFKIHTADTSNPHQTSLSNLTSSAHTHPISEVINLQTELNSKTDNTDFNTHTGDTTIHFTKSSINLSDLGSSAHTHTVSEITDFTENDVKVTGFTFNAGTYDLTIFQNGTNYTQNLGALASDIYVMSGVYNPSTGIVTYTTNSGQTFEVSGFTTGMTDSFTTTAYTVGNEIRFDSNIYGANFYSVDLSTLLDAKTNNTDFNTHTGDTSIHFTKSSINLSDLGNTAHTHTLSEITDFNAYSGSVNTQITAHTTDTNNPHQTSLQNLFGGSAHTHTLSEITNFNTYSGSVQTQLDSKIENGANVGGGFGVFSGKSGTTLIFRTISGGTNINVTQVDNTLVLSAGTGANTYVTSGTVTGDTTLVLTRNDAGTVTTDISYFNNNDVGVLYSGGAVWTNNGDGTLTLPEIEVNLSSEQNWVGPVRKYTVSSGTTGIDFTALLDENTNWIYIDYNGGSPIYVVTSTEPSYFRSDRAKFLTVYRAGNFLHILDWDKEGSGLANKLLQRHYDVKFIERANGLALSLSAGTNVIETTSGIVWNGVDRTNVSAANSNDDTFFTIYHSGGTFVYNTTATTVNNAFYDNGTDLVPLSPNRYVVNWIYRGVESDSHIYQVIGRAQYTSVALAQLATVPTIPELVSSHGILIGRIIMQQGVTGGVVESAFSTQFRASQVTSHNDLSGLQGGTAGEYYHLTSSEYTDLASKSLFDSHTGDTTIHFTKSSINLSDLGSSAHTHSISEVINLQTELDGKSSFAFQTISSTTVGQTFISASTVDDMFSLSGINVSILTDNTNKIITLSASTGGGGGAALTVKESDGSPTVNNVDTIVVTNGTLTDDGGGQVTITTGGGGSSGVNSDVKIFNWYMNIT